MGKVRDWLQRVRLTWRRLDIRFKPDSSAVESVNGLAREAAKILAADGDEGLPKQLELIIGEKSGGIYVVSYRTMLDRASLVLSAATVAWHYRSGLETAAGSFQDRVATELGATTPEDQLVVQAVVSGPSSQGGRVR